MSKRLQWLCETAVLVCKHELGMVGLVPGQDFVRINGKKVFVARDPEGRPIAGCPNVGATIKPCTSTLPVRQGYSDFLRIGGRAVCLETVEGLTDGTPPGVVEYKVRHAGQGLVSEVT